jgi:membrane-associated protease RseP (regulator of RpoE activity)
MSRTPLRAAAGAAVVGLLGLALWASSGSEPPTPTERPVAQKKSPRAKLRAEAPLGSDVVVRRSAPSEPAHELRAQMPAEPEELAEGLAVVIVDVVDENGRPDDDAWVVPVDCPEWDYGAQKGEYLAAPGPCTLRAARRDGALQAKGPIVTVELSPEEPAYVQLELPEHRKGGIGIRFRPTEEGIRVTSVAPGTPAFAAGIEPGDLIVAVGGEDVVDLDNDEFIDRMTGAVGTDVEFTVGIESDTGLTEETVRVTRAFLDI